MYSLFRAGLHGLNGLNPCTSMKVWSTYILPRVVHNLEVTLINPSAVGIMEAYQRKTMKQLQHLPECTSNPVTYLLCGILPIEGEIHKRVLTTFTRLLRDTSSAEYRIIKRQLALKDLSSNSWTSGVRMLTHMYGLPSAHDLLLNTPSKDGWKREVKRAIHVFHTEALKEECSKHASTRYINLASCSTRRTHHVWTSAGSNVREINRAVVKAKLLTGTYQLEGRKALMHRGGTHSGLCPLCGLETETRKHFLCECSALEDVRKRYLQELQDVPILIPSNLECQLKIILDPSHATQEDHRLQKAETITRRLCFALHHRRLLLLDAKSAPAASTSQRAAAHPAAKPGVPRTTWEHHDTR